MATKKAKKSPPSGPHATFVRDFRKAREALSLSQNALAKLAGLSSAYVNQIESGYSLPPPSDTLQEILSKAKVPPAVKSALLALGEKVRGAAKTSGRPGRLGRRKAATAAAPTSGKRTTVTREAEIVEQHGVLRVRVPVMPGARLVAFDFIYEHEKRGKRS